MSLQLQWEPQISSEVEILSGITLHNRVIHHPRSIVIIFQLSKIMIIEQLNIKAIAENGSGGSVIHLERLGSLHNLEACSVKSLDGVEVFSGGGQRQLLCSEGRLDVGVGEALDTFKIVIRPDSPFVVLHKGVMIIEAEEMDTCVRSGALPVVVLGLAAVVHLSRQGELIVDDDAIRVQVDPHAHLIVHPDGAVVPLAGL